MRALNPLWRIYIFIVATSLVVASAMIYIEWQEVKSTARIDLKYANNIFSQSLRSLLHKNEILLDVLGHRLVELDPEKHSVQAKNLIDELLRKSPELAGFGLANLDGQLILTSFNVDRSRLPNLLKTPQTAKSFKQALVSDSMVMGRTYYMKALKQWLIPIRYRIKDSQGKAVAVMTTGLKFDTTKSIWSSESLPKDIGTIIIRKDLYPQYVSDIKKSEYGITYNNKVKKEDFGFLHHQDLNKKLPPHNHDKESANISTVSFDKKYNFYAFIYIPIKALYKELLLPAVWLTALLVFFTIALYFVFRSSIASNAKNKRDMQAIFDHSPTIIYIRDLDGSFIFVNHQFEKLLLEKRENIVGKKPHDVFDEDTANRMTFNDQLMIKNGTSFEYEEDYSSNNKLYSFVSSKFPLYDNNNNIYAIAGISTDITERNQQEELLRNSQKMEALGKLTGGIAHDYNNMLGVILGYSELLRGSSQNKDEQLSYIDEIERAAQRGAKLTKKLLSFTREKGANEDVVDINALLQDEKNMLEKMLTARIKLTYDLDENLWPSLIDANDLEDAILNITINAMHAIKEHGELTIQTQNQTIQEHSPQYPGLKEGDYSTISITDTGRGMDDETQEKIFDPFYSTKGTKGTGLGLSQVYGFVHRSGGKITVISELDHGTQFKLYFPRHLGEHKAQTTNKTTPSEVAKGNETILLVDDEPAILKLTSEILNREGYNVLCAEDGAEALKILEENTVQLMLSDIVMPNMDGFKLAAITQEKYPSIKIQLASGFSSEYDSSQADASLKQYMLDKPFSQHVLLKRLRDLLDNNSL
jgi:PAS domain S-box-containing protein